MDLTKHKQVHHDCLSKAEYFQNIDFPAIATVFREAADCMAEMIDVLDKLNELTVEEAQGEHNE